MLSTSVVIGVLAGIVITLGVIWLVLLRKTKQKFAGFIIFWVLAGMSYFLVLDHVYILDESKDGRYYERIAIFPSDFTFENGDVVTVKPSGSFLSHSIILNNTNKRRTFETVIYGSSSGADKVRIPLRTYSMNVVRKTVDYILKPRPEQFPPRAAVQHVGGFTEQH